MKNREKKKLLVFGLLLVLLALVTCLPYQVTSPSMSPTLKKGDLLFVTPVFSVKPEKIRGQIIVFKSPEDGTLNIKRVLAVAGDRVETRGGKIYVNGDDRGLADYADHAWPIASRKIFVVGDNRGQSRDSFDFGPLSDKSIISIARWRYWPLSSFGRLH